MFRAHVGFNECCIVKKRDIKNISTMFGCDVYIFMSIRISGKMIITRNSIADASDISDFGDPIVYKRLNIRQLAAYVRERYIFFLVVSSDRSAILSL